MYDIVFVVWHLCQVEIMLYEYSNENWLYEYSNGGHDLLHNAIHESVKQHCNSIQYMDIIQNMEKMTKQERWQMFIEHFMENFSQV